MNRTLGFFLGSALVFVLLVYLLGQPVPLAPPARETTVSAPAPIEAPASTPVAAPVTPLPAVATAQAPEPGEIAPAESEPEPGAVEARPDSQREPGIAENGAAGEETFAVEAMAEPDYRLTNPSGLAVDDLSVNAAMNPGDAVTDDGDGESWFPVWDPFHSELSANAFARRLERITGLDYRVLRVGPAEYRVAVAYASEEQRQANVAAIEQATGLSITGGSR